MRKLHIVMVGVVASSCGGGSSTPDGGVDGGFDSTMNDTGADAAPPVDASNDAADGGPTCVMPDAASGTLDLGFSSGVKTIGSGRFFVRAATIDSAGTTYVLGSHTDCFDASAGYAFAIAHLDQSGNVDPNFPPRCLDFSAIDYGFAAAMLPANAPVVAGGSGNGATIGFGSVASVVVDGGANLAFNLTGQLLLPQSTGTPGPPGCPTTDTSTALSTINGIAVSTAGKIALVGSNTVNVCDPNDFAGAGTAGFVLQLNADGTVDSAFNAGQPVKDTTVAGFYGVAYDAAGNIVTVGESPVSSAGLPTSSSTASVRRYTGVGAADGTLEVSATGGMIGRSVVVRPDGSIMVGGSSSLTNFYGPLTVVRLTSALTLDATFNGGNPLVLPLTSDGYQQYSSLSVLCDGTVLAAGAYNSDSGTDPQDMALVKLTAAGAIDTSFGTSGLAIDVIAGAEIPVAVARDPSGRVIVVGRNATPQLVVARFNP
jgi:uncharacterized delta-60 repeat protein